MATTRPAELYQRRVRLTRAPAAAAEARGQVCAAIGDWRVPVDPDIAILLASDLVTSAITHGDGETLTLAIRCSRGQLRIDVYDKSGYRPAGANEPEDARAGHGLALIAALSTGWGSVRTPAGKAMYFTLAFQFDQPRAAIAAAGE